MAKTTNLDRAQALVKEIRKDEAPEPALAIQKAQTFALLAIAELLDELVDSTVEANEQ